MTTCGVMKRRVGDRHHEREWLEVISTVRRFASGRRSRSRARVMSITDPTLPRDGTDDLETLRVLRRIVHRTTLGCDFSFTATSLCVCSFVFFCLNTAQQLTRGG